MAWDNVPPEAGDDIQHWHWIRQFWKALQERGFCISQTVWYARLAAGWDTGVITGATRTSITDSTKNWASDWWTSNNGHNWVPDKYDVVIYDEDPRKIQRMAIVGNDGTTLQVAETDWYDPNIYVGKHYFIITGYSPWIQERTPKGPNDHPLDYGKATNRTASKLTDTRKQWQAGQWIGKHVVVEQGSRNRRGVITDNTATELFFTGQGWVVAADQRYVIVEPDAVYEFERVPDPIYLWSGSPKSAWLTHDSANDGVMTTFLPVASMSLPPDGHSVDCFDRDLWSEVADENTTPDTCYTPAVYSTIRGLQIAVENLCSCFVEPVDHTGRNALENFNMATWFECIGVNTASTTITGVDDDNQKTFFSPSIAGKFLADTHEVFLVCMDGYKLLWSRPVTLSLGESASSLNFAVNHNDIGKRLIFAFGWTRRLPREFTRFYPQTVFQPEINPEAEGPVIPPTPEHPGFWRHHPASTRYTLTTALGFIAASDDSHDLFAEGDLARYSGQNWNDPTLGPAGDGAENDPLVLIQNSFYVGKKSPQWQFGDSGIVSAGGTWWLRDTTKAWWDFGTLVEHAGTATGGTATSLTDDDKAGDGFWTTEGRGRFAGHILEITSGAHAGTRVPVDSQAGLTLTFRDLGFSVAGLNYRIREPAYELNRWQQRTLKITRTDGTVLPPIVITHSDDNTLFFVAQAEAIEPGWRYEIAEASTGTVWLRHSGQWIVPPPEVYGPNQFAVEPTVVRRYGRCNKGDYITGELFDEISRGINILRHIAYPATWTAFERPWIDTPIVFGKVDTGAMGCLTDYQFPFPTDIVGKDVQIRNRYTNVMSRFTIIGVSDYTLCFDDPTYQTNWGDDYWVLDPNASDVVLNDRVAADSLGGGNHNDWTGAYDAVANIWNNPVYPEQFPRLADGAPPKCLTISSDYQGYDDPGTFYYSATLAGTDAFGRANLPYRNWDGALFSAQSDFYALTDLGQARILPQHEAEFINNGEIGQSQKWMTFDTKASRTDGNPTVTRKFGDVGTMPAMGQAPPPTPVPDGSAMYDTMNGFLVTDAKAVLHFETTGLLTLL